MHESTDQQSQQLHFAAMDGDIDAIEACLAARFPIDQFDETGRTALHLAAQNNHLEAVRVLLRGGANVNAINPDVCGDTPLGSIAGNCSLAMAALLLQAGANPRIPGPMKLTAIDRAKDRKRGDGPAVYKLLANTKSSRR